MQKSTLMTVRQVAAALGESPSTVTRRIEAGTLAAEKMDGRRGMFLIARIDVEQLIAARAEELRAEIQRLEDSTSDTEPAA